MDLHEALYWQRAPGQWVNLEPYLPRLRSPGWPRLEMADPDPNAVQSDWCYRGSQRSIPALAEALASLRCAHPQARTAPPYRQVTIRVCVVPLVAIYDEITAALDDGFFVGAITRLDHWTTGAVITVHEMAYLLARTHVDTSTFLPVLS